MTYYQYHVEKRIKLCYIWIRGGKFIGSIQIDDTGAWTPHYEEGVAYLPINSALKLLEYPGMEHEIIV